MDKTLTPLKGTKRAGARNEKAWLLFSPDGTYCRFCPHADTDHLCSSSQPHFYQLATEQEREDPFLQLYLHNLADGVSVQVKRIVVSKRVELLTAFCAACAQEKETSQVLCFQRTLAIGEVVGLEKHDAVDGVARIPA